MAPLHLSDASEQQEAIASLEVFSQDKEHGLESHCSYSQLWIFQRFLTSLSLSFLFFRMRRASPWVGSWVDKSEPQALWGGLSSRSKGWPVSSSHVHRLGGISREGQHALLQRPRSLQGPHERPHPHTSWQELNSFYHPNPLTSSVCIRSQANVLKWCLQGRASFILVYCIFMLKLLFAFCCCCCCFRSLLPSFPVCYGCSSFFASLKATTWAVCYLSVNTFPGAKYLSVLPKGSNNIIRK